jgi:gliding motility-associated protein GldM
MGHGKETPRQKMIGMMYLMLTAMLALNVSKDVLMAFALVDEGIVQSVVNTEKKSNSVWADFEKRITTQKSQKIIAYHDHAEKIREMSKDICDFIKNDCKKTIVQKSEGEDFIEEHFHDHGPELMEVNGKDNTDIPATVMVGSEGSGKGKVLKQKIDDFRDYIFKLPGLNEGKLHDRIDSVLNTAPQRHHDQTMPWVQANFEHLPLAGVIAILSGIESNIRNVEFDVISYLYSKIDEGAISFNKLNAVVIPNSNYVIRGGEYKAEIFIAASDTTVDPIILLGDYEYGPEDAEPKWKGKVDTVPVEKGIGNFVQVADRVGKQDYKGIIATPKPDGTYSYQEFSKEYTVAPPMAVVSPTKMNVFYLGVDNPVEVSVPGFQPADIKPGITNGRMYARGNSWMVRPGRAGTAYVNVNVQMDDGKLKSMGRKEFRVKVVPDPVAKVAQMPGGDINKSVLMAQSVVIAEIPDFLFDLRFEVVSFNVYTQDKAGFVKEARTGSKVITGAQKQIIQGLGTGQRVYFDEIKVRKPGGIVVSLPSLIFKIK